MGVTIMIIKIDDDGNVNILQTKANKQTKTKQQTKAKQQQDQKVIEKHSQMKTKKNGKNTCNVYELALANFLLAKNYKLLHIYHNAKGKEGYVYVFLFNRAIRHAMHTWKKRVELEKAKADVDIIDTSKKADTDISLDDVCEGIQSSDKD